MHGAASIQKSRLKISDSAGSHGRLFDAHTSLWKSWALISSAAMPWVMISRSPIIQLHEVGLTVTIHKWSNQMAGWPIREMPFQLKIIKLPQTTHWGILLKYLALVLHVPIKGSDNSTMQKNTSILHKFNTASAIINNRQIGVKNLTRTELAIMTVQDTKHLLVL